MRRILLIFLFALAFTVLGYWLAKILGYGSSAAHRDIYLWAWHIGFAIFLLGIMLHLLAAAALTRLFPSKQTPLIGASIMIVSIVFWKLIPQGEKGPNWESGLTEITLLWFLCGSMVLLDGTIRWSLQAFGREAHRPQL